MKKMMGKGKGLSDIEKEAKLGVLAKISGDAEDAMGGKLQKVVVSADSKKGLSKGLDIAKEKIGEDEDEVKMGKKDFVKEHKNLVDTLRSPSREDDLEEADEQEDELEEEVSDEEMGELEEEGEEDNEEFDDIESEIEELEKKLEELKNKR